MFLDTSIVVELLRSKKDSRKSERILNRIGDDALYVSVIQLGELADWCYRNNFQPTKYVRKLKEVASITPLDEELCLAGAEIKKQLRGRGVKKFGLIDGIILSSARKLEQDLLSSDSDFIDIVDVIYLN